MLPSSLIMLSFHSLISFSSNLYLFQSERLDMPGMSLIGVFDGFFPLKISVLSSIMRKKLPIGRKMSPYFGGIILQETNCLKQVLPFYSSSLPELFSAFILFYSLPPFSTSYLLPHVLYFLYSTFLHDLLPTPFPGLLPLLLSLSLSRFHRTSWFHYIQCF